jgi:hypothetical protein
MPSSAAAHIAGAAAAAHTAAAAAAAAADATASTDPCCSGNSRSSYGLRWCALALMQNHQPLTAVLTIVTVAALATFQRPVLLLLLCILLHGPIVAFLCPLFNASATSTDVRLFRF